MKQLLLAGLGGFLGSACRYLVGVALPSTLGGLPLPTMIVNVVGSFLIGALAGFGEGRLGASTWTFAVVGCLGGFTTFSALSLETLTLLRAGSGALALMSVGLQVVLGVLAAGLGHLATR